MCNPRLGLHSLPRGGARRSSLPASPRRAHTAAPPRTPLAAFSRNSKMSAFERNRSRMAFLGEVVLLPQRPSSRHGLLPWLGKTICQTEGGGLRTAGLAGRSAWRPTPPTARARPSWGPRGSGGRSGLGGRSGEASGRPRRRGRTLKGSIEIPITERRACLGTQSRQQRWSGGT
jgi:hypothetical protein